VNTIRADDLGLELGVYQAFGDRFTCALILLESDLRIVWTNPAAGEVLGRPSEELLGMNVLDLVHSDDLDQIMPMALEIVGQAAETLDEPAAASTVELPVRVLSAAGTWVPVSVTGRVFDESGRLLAVIRPAAERHALDRVLDEMSGGVSLERILESLVTLLCAQFQVDDAWLIHDHDGGAVVIGSDADPSVGQPEALLAEIRDDGLSGDVRADEHRWVAPVLSATQESLFAALVLPSPRVGGPNPFDNHVLRRTTNLTSLAFTRAGDDRLLHHAATTDHLTRVLNRRAFESQLAQHALRADDFPVTLLFVDVDRFKLVNDEHGHRAGDEVLVAVAKRICASVRSRDSVGRVGGDEFAISCPGMSHEHAEVARQRLHEAFAAPIKLKTHDIAVSVTVGVATANDEDDLEQVVDRSDADMYAHKPRR